MRLWPGRITNRQKFELALLTALVLGIVLLYGAFIRPGVTWADDWAMYIQDGLNILHGDRYSATGYIFNPASDIGPTAYPPLYPLTLVLPLALWGVDYHAIREFQGISWAVFLYLFYFLARLRLGFGFALLLVALTGLSPYFFVFKDYITAESLFLPLLYGFFLLAARIEQKSPDGEITVMDGVWLGLLASLCVATRSVGLVLLAVLAGYDLLRFRRLRRASLVAMAIVIVSFLLQMAFVDFFKDYAVALYSNTHAELRSVRPSNGILQQVAGLPSIAMHRLTAFAGELSRLWGEGSYGGWLPRILSVVLVAMAGLGLAGAARRTLMHCDIFFLLYCAVLLALPSPMAVARMQMPIYPLFYFYVLIAAAAWRGDRVWRAGAAAVLVLGVACYWQSFRQLDFRAPLVGILGTDYQDMFGYIESHTGPGDVIVFDKPRTLSLYTGRRAVAIYEVRNGEFLSYMNRFAARYILLQEPRSNMTPQQSLREILGDDAGRFAVVHAGGQYFLYEMKDGRS